MYSYQNTIYRGTQLLNADKKYKNKAIITRNNQIKNCIKTRTLLPVAKFVKGRDGKRRKKREGEKKRRKK